MISQEKILSSLQEGMDKYDSGILMSIEIINISELNILIENVDELLNSFYLIVEKVCKKIAKNQIITSNKAHKLYVLIPDDVKGAESIAYTIYSQIQLYVDKKNPESYLQCSVGSIKFSKNQNLSAFDIVSRLSYGMQHSEEQGYYFSYDDNPVDIERIRSENIKLNLLRSSLLDKRVKFMYQPIIDRKTGEVEYHECLLRIPDKNNNYISVGPIISHAESKGLINVVDFTVIEMAVNELIKDPKIVH